MKQLNWYQIFGNTHKIPDGRTVTPTDDIQIWLHCADIWDKSYTTLAEVLNDTDTLSALMASDNAVDYLVRSTSWAVSVTIPNMTSATTPSGVVSGNYETTGSTAGYKAFDGDSNTYAYKDNSSDFGYGDLWYTFPNPVTVKKAVISYGYNVAMTNVHTEINAVQAYVNDEWVTLDTFAYATTSRTSPTTITLNFDSFTAETDRYRLKLPTRYTSAYGLYIPDIIVEAQFYSASITADSNAMTYIGQNNYCANTLLADATWCNAICNSEYFESVLNVKVPTMTDNTHPSGVASADNIYSAAFDAWRAFTGLTVSAGNLGWSPAGSGSHWVQYDFGELVCIKKIQYKGGYYPANLDAVLKGSTDNITFSDILNIPNPASDTYDTMTAIIANNNLRHRYIRVDHVRENSYGYKLQFYGRKDV